MYKQLIIARRDLNMSPGKLAAQVSHASMAFLTTEIRRRAEKVWTNRSLAFDMNGPIMYRREDLYQWAKEAYARGEQYFYHEPVDKDKPYGPHKLCEPKAYMSSELEFDMDLWNGWINDGSFAKVVCGARDMNHLQRAIDKAISLGMKEGKDFFIIRDSYCTELEPEEVLPDTITCIGFRPMPEEAIDQIGKEYETIS